MTQQSNQLQEDGYSIDDFKSGKVEADLKALSGVNDTNLGRPNQTPQSTFDEKVTDTLIDFVFEVYGSILPTDHPELVKSVAAITSLVLEEVEAQKPTHIMGKPLEEVVQILSALKLERIADMQMTMNKLSDWMELVREDHRKAVQRSLDKTMEQFTQRSIITKESE